MAIGSVSKKSSKRASSRTAGFLDSIFYLVIIVILLIAIMVTGRSDHPKSLFGYSIFTVLTRSMQSEIPQYSFLVTKEVDPKTLEVGNDVTYIVEDGRTITHRIIAKKDNYMGTGEIGFTTQGVDNPKPDADIVYGKNVIGIVIFHNLTVGKGIRFVALYWKQLMVPAGVAMICLFLIKRMYRKKSREEAAAEEQERQISLEPVAAAASCSQPVVCTHFTDCANFRRVHQSCPNEINSNATSQ